MHAPRVCKVPLDLRPAIRRGDHVGEVERRKGVAGETTLSKLVPGVLPTPARD
jgi:hypothetical protein